jgi:hypothetical protein
MKMALLTAPSAAAGLAEFNSQFTIIKGVYSASLVSPHSLTTRVSIAIPDGQRGLLLNGLIFLMRDTVPIVLDMARAVMEVAGVEVVSEIREINNAAGWPHVNQVPRGDVFAPSQTLTISTADFSGGGSYTYVLSAAVLLGPLT